MGMPEILNFPISPCASASVAFFSRQTGSRIMPDSERFTLSDLARLPFGIHVSVDDAHAPHPRQRDGKGGLGDGVHGRREEGEC